MNRTPALVSVVCGALLIAFLLMGPGGSLASGPQANPLDVVINEVAWSGTLDDYNDEWIELYNTTAAPVDLSGWTLVAGDGSPDVTLAGVVPAHGFYLLERSDDDAVADIPADQTYTGSLLDTGESLQLKDPAETLIDAANAAGGPWPGGTGASGTPPRASMERVRATQPGAEANWSTNNGLIRRGHGKNGTAINGTPKARNSASYADLSVSKHGPPTVKPGAALTYTLAVSNPGVLPAASARLTDRLPVGVEFLAQTAPYPFSQPLSGTLVWDLGDVPTGTAPVTFTVVGQVDPDAYGELTNLLTGTSATTESRPADNVDQVTTQVGGGATPTVVIEALYYRAYEPLDADEAVRLRNVSTVTAQIGGWSLTDREATATFPPGASLAPGQALWCAQQAAAFARQFGFVPDYEYGADTDPAVPDLLGGAPKFGDDDECILRDAANATLDALVYEGGDTAIDGWSGPAVEPWTSGSSFAQEGQILYRKRDQATGQPVADTDTAADWAQDPADQVDGRKVLYPGWDLDAFFFTARITETAALTVAVAPDNLYDTVAALLARAQSSIQIEAYTIESRELADLLLDRLAHGASVSLLLEGAPAFEGVSDEEKWIAGQLHAAGAQVLFMVNDDANHVHDRYSNQHAKLIVVDGALALVGSENLNPTSLPADDKADGTAGRRGVYLVTDAPGVVSRVEAVLAADADPAHHADLVDCDQAAAFCTPPFGFEPAPTPNWTTYTVQFPAPLSTQGVFAFEVVQSPENSLRTRDSLLGLLARAGEGDVILAEQFYEYQHWGAADGAPETDPNLRLLAYVDAARRGATVRVLLDRHFDSDGDNAATVLYLKRLARHEDLDLQARLGDPTSLGVHNKMVLARIDGRGWVHAGSLNGSEASSKVNRELALQVQSDAAYGYLAAVFEYDWLASVPPIYLPVVVRGYQPPLPAKHLLISEVYYGTIPEKEWVELYNPTTATVDLSAYKIGDAADPADAEGMFQFPPGTSLPPNGLLVVAATASGFGEDHPGQLPDFEIVDSDPAVPDLLDYPAWGTWEWGLSNAGDEVLLLDGDDQPVDVLVYGAGSFPGVTPHPGGIAFGHSLERYPAWWDSDDCSADFRDWPYPNPGDLP